MKQDCSTYHGLSGHDTGANGFSLVELSIVLVILGLLTGGILTGQTLIRAAELRAVTTELQNYQTAVSTFRDRYFAIPGDMRNAEDFWGTMTGGCPTSTPVGGSTCNGNGDGIINAALAAGQAGERFTFWQHLANAGLLEGSFTGIAGGGGTNDHVADENAPRSKFSNGIWSTATRIPAGTHFNRVYGNTFMLGAATAGAAPNTVLFTPEEMWNIDTKLDDGMPAQGNVGVLAFGGACNNGANATDFAATYTLTNDVVACLANFSEVY